MRKHLCIILGPCRAAGVEEPWVIGYVYITVGRVSLTEYRKEMIIYAIELSKTLVAAVEIRMFWLKP